MENSVKTAGLSPSPSIKIKRAYEPSEPSDGYRIYIDRLWPQGLSHQTFTYDLWDKEISPSTQLREFLHADPAKNWPEFISKYKSELKNNPDFERLKQVVSEHKTVTLLYSSRNETENNAVVLRDALMEG